MLLDGAIRGEIFNNAFLNDSFQIKEAQRFITKFPIKHENVIMYLASFYEGDYELFKLLKKRVRGDTFPVKWMEQWYIPSLELVPEKYRDALREKITEYIEPMDEEMIETVEQWDLTSMLESEEYKKLHEKLLITLFNRFVERSKRTDTLKSVLFGK